MRPVAVGIAAAQGLALIANGLAVAWVVIRDGISGPSAVATPGGVAVEVLLYVVFGSALLWVARGLAKGSPFVLTPFVLAQVLGLTVSVPLAGGGGAAGIIGWLVTLSCLLGIVAWVGLLRRRQD